MKTAEWIAFSDEEFLASRRQALQCGVLKLLSWPDLNQVPEVRQALVARICALLGRRPSAGPLIPLLLSEPEADVLRELGPLMRLGHVAIATATFQNPTSEESPTAPATRAQAQRSLVSKLWARLTAAL